MHYDVRSLLGLLHQGLSDVRALLYHEGHFNVIVCFIKPALRNYVGTGVFGPF